MGLPKFPDHSLHVYTTVMKVEMNTIYLPQKNQSKLFCPRYSFGKIQYNTYIWASKLFAIHAHAIFVVSKEFCSRFFKSFQDENQQLSELIVNMCVRILNQIQ